ncbi:hypothetical protein MXD81_34895 [Microbacteriaceae bacterium K1510]|nr:hypothetical protein [Microbacteriaceae bacterium K1510]
MTAASAAIPVTTAGHFKCAQRSERNGIVLDVYLFVYGKRDNIKFRGKGLKVKPIVEAFDEFSAFAPSEKISFPAKASVLSTVFPRFNEIQAKLGSREELLAALSATGYRKPLSYGASRTGPRHSHRERHCGWLWRVLGTDRPEWG